MGTIGENVRRLREAKDWSQEDLGRESRTSQTTIDNIEAGRTKRSKFLPMVAVALDVPLEEIDEELRKGATPTLRRNDLVGAADLPVFASAEGGEGQLIISTDVVDRVLRPTPLLHVRDGYGILITGESMVPAFRPGDIALVHPQMPPRADDAVILYNADESRASIKEFRAGSEKVWHLRRYRPKEEDFTLSKRDWPKAHTVVGRYTRR